MFHALFFICGRNATCCCARKAIFLVVFDRIPDARGDCEGSKNAKPTVFLIQFAILGCGNFCAFDRKCFNTNGFLRFPRTQEKSKTHSVLRLFFILDADTGRRCPGNAVILLEFYRIAQARSACARRKMQNPQCFSFIL